MKTTSKNDSALINLFLIPLVTAVFGYNFYPVMIHP